MGAHASSLLSDVAVQRPSRWPTADATRTSIAGLDVARNAQAVRKLIGLSGQYAAVDGDLAGRENLWMFGRRYQLGSGEARLRATELLARFDLEDAADRVTKTYSGGCDGASTSPPL